MKLTSRRVDTFGTAQGNGTAVINRAKKPGEPAKLTLWSEAMTLRGWHTSLEHVLPRHRKNPQCARVQH